LLKNLFFAPDAAVRLITGAMLLVQGTCNAIDAKIKTVGINLLLADHSALRNTLQYVALAAVAI
jgi:hypothetical protein